MAKKEKKKMGVGSKIVLVIAIGVFCVSGGMLAKHLLTDYSADRDFSKLEVNGTHDLVKLHKKNSDLVGWVQVKDTKIDYPVMQTPNEPEFYLRRNFEKEDSISGTPFMDAASKIGSSQNYVIYGHNIKSGTMFHQLLKYEDRDFWEDHKTFTYDQWIDGKQVNGKCEVVAAFYSQIYPDKSKEFKYYEYADIEDSQRLQEYVSGIKALSAYDTGVKVSNDDTLVTLSTCAYQVEDGRFAVVGRLITEE